MVAIPPSPHSPFYRAAPITNRETVRNYWNFLNDSSSSDIFQSQDNHYQSQPESNEQQHLYNARMQELFHRIFPGHPPNSVLPSTQQHNHTPIRLNDSPEENRDLEHAIHNSRITYAQEEQQRARAREAQLANDEQLARQLQNEWNESFRNHSRRSSFHNSSSASSSSLNIFNSQNNLLRQPATPSYSTRHQSSMSVWVGNIIRKIGRIFKSQSREIPRQESIVNVAELRKELDRLGQENNKVDEEIKLLLKNKVGVDGITKNRGEFTFQFDLEHPVFQDTEDMGIRTIHKNATWKSLQQEGLLPSMFSKKDVKPVVTTTTYVGRTRAHDVTYDRNAGETWKPPSKSRRLWGLLCR